MGSMKLSEQLEYWSMPLKMSVEEGRNCIDRVQQLESDSEMLTDLIEMLYSDQFHMVKNGSFVRLIRAAKDSTGQDRYLTAGVATTPYWRRAIAAAIKEWKKNK